MLVSKPGASNQIPSPCPTRGSTTRTFTCFRDSSRNSSKTADAETPFDAVYCSEVLEHVPDVNSFVGAIARATKPGGVLYLTTPDIAHRRVPDNVLEWDSFFPPSHCIYFTPASLTQLLSRHGYSIFRKRLAFKPAIKVFARRL